MRKVFIFVIWSYRTSLFPSHSSFLPLTLPSFFFQPPTLCISFINEIILSKQYCHSPRGQAFLKQTYLAKVTTFPHTPIWQSEQCEYTLCNGRLSTHTNGSYWDQNQLGFSLHFTREHLHPPKWNNSRAWWSKNMSTMSIIDSTDTKQWEDTQ